MIWPIKEMNLQLPHAKIDYIRFGNGPKPLVMIQGLNTRGIKGAGVPLAFLYRLFTKQYTVYLFERRPNVYDGITVRELASDVAMAMDTLNLGAADVIGVSQGGMIAQYLAIERPDLVNKLVLAMTICRNNSTVKSVIDRWLTLTSQGNMKLLIADMAEKMYSDAYLKRYRPLLPLLTILQKPKDVERFMILSKACLTCNTYENLDQIRCPVFVIGSKHDKIVGAEAAAELAEKLQCSSLIYEHLGHAAYEEANDFNHAVLAFFNQNNSSIT